MKAIRHLLIVGCILFAANSFAQTIYYVDAAKADNSGGGITWGSAKKDLQAALDLAVSGDQIWVKAGTYYPTVVPPLSIVTATTVRDKTFNLKPGVPIYGGFNGTETAVSQRNWQSNITTLSGDIGNANDSTDNCYHVMIVSSNADTCKVNGFVITGGNANGTNQIFVNGNSFDRSLGAGVHCQYSSPYFQNCIFKNNYSKGGGAAVYNHITSTTLINCVLINNNSNGDGAAMYSSSSNITSTNCVFAYNNSNGYGGALYNSALHSTFTNCVFAQNTAGQNGGAIYSYEDYNFYGTGTNLINCTVYNNQAIGNSSLGGGICYGYNSSAPIKNCIFWNNTTPNNFSDASNAEDINHNAVINGPSGSFVSVQFSIVSSNSGSPGNATFFNCINSDPLFLNTNDFDGADNIWGTSDDGLRLQSSSPAINFGSPIITTPTTDITGYTRTGFFDVGAYEYYETCTTTYGTTNQSICSGSSYLFNGVNLTAAGTYYDTLVNSGGCDSVLTLNLTIKSTSTSTTNLSICSSQLPYSWNGLTFNGAGTQTAHLTNSNSCDSAATLNLTVKSTSTSTTNTSICSTALPYSWNGLTFNTAGTQTAHLTNTAGCDSAATLNLTVNSPTSSTTNVTSCVNYTWNGVVYTSSGTYTKTGLTNSKGCDSTATLVLTIANVSISNNAATACDSYVWNGTTYTTSGNYSKTFINGSVNGCDSVANLSLTINHSTSSTTNLSLCSHLLPYTWNGLTFTNYGSKTAHFTNSVGCDSAATLNLAVSNTLPAITGSNSICVGVPVTLSNTVSGGIWSSTIGRANVSSTGIVTGTSQGTATIKYTIPSGSCAGSVSKSVAVNALPATPIVAYAPNTPSPQTTSIGGVITLCKNKTFTLVGTPANGIWSKTGVISISPSGTPSTNTTVNTGNTAGATSVTYTITDANGCRSNRTFNANVVACASKGIANQAVTNNEQLVIYPNPAHSIINVNVKTLSGTGSILLTDLYGKTVKQQPLSMGTNTINVSHLAKGMYLVSIITEQGKETQKIVVE